MRRTKTVWCIIFDDYYTRWRRVDNIDSVTYLKHWNGLVEDYEKSKKV